MNEQYCVLCYSKDGRSILSVRGPFDDKPSAEAWASNWATLEGRGYEIRPFKPPYQLPQVRQ